MRPLAVIATMHGKERVLGPALDGFGMDWLLSNGLDTDSFGTFTGDVARPGGRPCRHCGAPTNEVSAEVRACDGCGQKEVTDIAGFGDPRCCLQCNP